MCPCHGGVYYEDGSYASGPPPRGLYEYDIRFRRPGANGAALTAEEFQKTSPEARGEFIVQIDVSHLPTLQDPLRKRQQGGKA
jgi:hypothetical protein